MITNEQKVQVVVHTLRRASIDEKAVAHQARYSTGKAISAIFVGFRYVITSRNQVKAVTWFMDEVRKNCPIGVLVDMKYVLDRLRERKDHLYDLWGALYNVTEYIRYEKALAGERY